MLFFCLFFWRTSVCLCFSCAICTCLLMPSSTVRAEDITLYAVSTARETASRSGLVSYEYSESYTVSAIGTASDGSATTYVIEDAISKIDWVYTDTTVELLSEPLTLTNTFAQGASTYEQVYPNIYTAWTTTETGLDGQPTATKTSSEAFMIGYSQGCSFDLNASSGACVYSTMPFVVGGGDMTVSPTATTHTGPLIPYYTLTSEENGAGSGMLPAALAAILSLASSILLGFWMTMAPRLTL
ncbi:hypothetical protein BD626DRAFT_503751 [Schizophyllum amplum]|uniref:Uncharacterized protein n=1 Tax=Schizophyllum amplum TaxID=97359 RepID=A0A550C7H3_9AGAR|nr:hypothetical protein BD626DRAFT_503751 [Auriculariopsis ampla]